MRERPVGPSAFPFLPPLSVLRQHSDSNMAVPIAKFLAAYAYLLLISLIFPHVFADNAAGDLPHRRFEYKYSFKGPHLTQSDGRIPFWIHTGSKFIDGCLSVWSLSSICFSVCHLSVCLVHVRTCSLNAPSSLCEVALKWTEPEWCTASIAFLNEWFWVTLLVHEGFLVIMHIMIFVTHFKV